MMSSKARFLNSVSGIALTAALASMALPARADSDSASGTATPGLNQNITITSIPFVEAESSDSLNTVEVTGIVQGSAAVNHLNAIGVYVTQWDIEASEATDSFIGQTGGSLAANTATISGSVAGTVINPTYAPGTGSYGVRVTDDIQVEDATAYGSYSGDGNTSVSAIARNTVTGPLGAPASGVVAGSAIDSYGIRVDGDVHATFAQSNLDIDSYFSATNIAIGTGKALNVVGIQGSVGGQGASNGSTGFYVGGDVYADEAIADGGTYVYIQQFGFYLNVASVYTTGRASLDLEAANSVGINGSVIADGGNLAVGVRILGSAYAEGAWAAGEAVSDGDQAEISSAYAEIKANNTVVVTGDVTGLAGPATGVNIDGDVYATDAVASGESIARFASFYGEGGGSATTADIIVVAGNAVSIAGSVSSPAGGVGVVVGEGVFATNATAEGFAGANPYNYENESNVRADATAQASNTVLISGTAHVSNATGVDISEGVYAQNAESDSYATAYANLSNGSTLAATGSAGVVSTASNAIVITGIVDPSLTNAIGVDPLFVRASDAYAYGDAYSSVSGTDAAGSTSDAGSSIAASNIAAIAGSLGSGVSSSTGVTVEWDVTAINAQADGYANAYAYSTNNNTVTTASATATAVNDVAAGNVASAAGSLGDGVVGSTGVWIGEGVEARWADAYGYTYAYASTTYNTATGAIAADALATATSDIAASNLASVQGILGVDADDSTGVYVGEGVGAYNVYSEGSTYAYAYNTGNAGNATATAEGGYVASNVASAIGGLGEGALGSTGVYVGEGVEAINAFAEGNVYADAQIFLGQGGGDATATATGPVTASNLALVSGTLGPLAEGSTGVHVGWDVIAANANAYGSTTAYASVYGGVAGDAMASAFEDVSATNLAIVTGALGDDAFESTGVWVGEGVGAFDAFAEGSARANAYAYANSGSALATAEGGAAASNTAVAGGSLGINADHSVGVYVGEGVAAANAFAEGSSYAYAQVDGGQGAGNASATATNVATASNLVSIDGTLGSGAEGSAGVWVDGVTFVYSALPFPVPVGAGALNAFAEGDSYASADNYGGTGSAFATAGNEVTASNSVVIAGAVGPQSVYSEGAWIGEGPVVAAFAEAVGSTTAYAYKDNGAGNATAQAEGGIAAANAVVLSGSIGDASFNSYGVYVGGGPVGSGLALADGNFYASANRNGSGNGDATASVGAEGAAAGVAATNVAIIDGYVSGVNPEGGGWQNNTGVWIDGDVGAVGALAEGSFGANAWRQDSGSGSATASAYGSVGAENDVVIGGIVGAGDSLAGIGEGSVGEGNTGVWIGGNVAAIGALAEGNAYTNTERNGAGSGDSNATTDLGTFARNFVSVGGTVGDYNAYSAGVFIGEGVTATLAFAEGSTSATAYDNGSGNGNATATATGATGASNVIGITGITGSASDFTGAYNAGVRIGEGVTATLAFAEGSTSATAYDNGSGNGNATATATNTATAQNVIAIIGIVADAPYDDYSVGVAIGEGVSATLAFAEGSANAYADRSGAGVGIATATATDITGASNVVSITGSVGYDSWDSYGVDPLFVTASGATAVSSAGATANGPAGSTATANSTATAANVVSITGSVAGDPSLSTYGSTGVLVVNDVTATDASASASTYLNTGGSATGTATASAIAQNYVGLAGTVGTNGDGNVGVDIGGNVVLGGLAISLSSEVYANNGTTGVATANGTMTNVAVISGDVGSGVNATNSQGVRIGGDVQFGGDVSTSLSYNLNETGGGTASALQVIEGMNIARIDGTVGSASTGSQGVYIGGNVEVTNTLTSNFVIAGVDATNDGTTRGVWIGGSVITGDAYNSQVAAQSDGLNTADPVIPDPLQEGDYVELAGSVFIGADGGLNPYGVAVGDGNDTVLVRDTHFQMEVVNGFDGGANPDIDGQDRITFDAAQIFVSNIDNFELMNVFNGSMVILTNPTPYTYAVRDEVNIAGQGILSFGDGGATPPSPIASGAPLDTLQLDTTMLTIGGIAGVKSAFADDSILKAENDGNGSYVINAENVYNFGTITLSKVLSAARGTDPHGLLSPSATSFDEAAEQQYWAVTGSWAIDPTSGAGDLLTINANYTAGSDVIVDAFVFQTGSASDTVVINGTVAGTTTVWVNNTNVTGQGALTGRGPTDGLLLVDINNGSQTPGDVAGTFVLGNTSGWNWADPVNFPEPEMQVGAFVYDLEQGGTDGKDFYLQSQLLDQVPAYTVMSSAIQQHFYGELGTLYQRMGELRHADTGSKANSSFFEFWLRAYGQDLEMKPGKGFDFDMTSKGLMIGGDYAVRNWVKPQSRMHFGAFAGYGWTKLDDIKGPVGNSDGKTDGYTVGAYATYFDTAKKGQGLYADAVLKFNFLDSEYSSSTRNTKAKSDDFAWGGSLEVGYGIGLGGGFIVQPQGQLSYMRVENEKFKESKTPGIPLEVDRDTAESLRGRLGLQLQNTFMLGSSTQFSPYVIGNVLHEFMGDNKTTVSGTEFRNDMGGTWYNAGAGFTLDFDNVGLYGHVEYNFGDRIEGLGAGLGVKVRLGGSTPVAAAPAAPPAPAMAPKKNFLVFFDFDRSNITADAQKVIDEAAAVAKAGNVSRLQLTGHTDRSGSEQYNMALSLRRGEAVKQALIARGIPAASISIIARGESQPLVPTADGVREPQNRRVEILL